MSHHSEQHAHEAATQPPAEPGEGEMPDEVCVCGHPRSEHNHVDDMTGCGHFMTDDDTLCECDYFRVISPSQAHDTPAAQLRERLQKAERERDEARADGKRYLERIDELTKECNQIYKDKQGTDRVLRDIRYAMHLDAGYDIIEHAEFLYMYRRNNEETEKKLIIQLEKMRADKEYWSKQWAHLVFEQGSNKEIIEVKQQRDLARASLENWRTIAKDLADMLGVCQMECGVTEALLSKSESMAEQTEAEAERLRGLLGTAIIDEPSQFVWAGSNPFTGKQVLDLLNENERLRGQVAAWMDNYNAAKVAEGEAYRRGYEAAKADAYDIVNKYPKSAWARKVEALAEIYALQPAPRPDSEAKP